MIFAKRKAFPFTWSHIYNQETSKIHNQTASFPSTQAELPGIVVAASKNANVANIAEKKRSGRMGGH